MVTQQLDGNGLMLLLLCHRVRYELKQSKSSRRNGAGASIRTCTVLVVIHKFSTNTMVHPSCLYQQTRHSPLHTMPQPLLQALWLGNTDTAC